MFTRSGFLKFFSRNHLFYSCLSEPCPVVKAGFFISHQSEDERDFSFLIKAKMNGRLTKCSG